MPVTIDASTVEVVTLDELKKHLNISRNTDDAELLFTLDAAHGAVEGIVGPIRHRVVTETVRTNSRTVVLRFSPIVSVTSLTAGGANVTYTLDPVTGLLGDVYASGAMTATYVAGRTVVPDQIRYAILIVAAHLWRTQQGAASPSSGLQGEEDPFPTPGLGFAIPARAQDLLAPYALPPTVA